MSLLDKPFQVRKVGDLWETPYGFCAPSIDFPYDGLTSAEINSKKALVPGIAHQYKVLSHRFLLEMGSK